MATKKKTKPTRQTSQTRQTRQKATPRKAIGRKPGGPALFRINVEVGDLAQACKQWGKLLGLESRLQAGARCYFTAGAVTLQVVQTSPVHPAAKALYFVVDDLDAVHARAEGLGWLSQERVHGEPGGDISVRPWGERSFYAQDAWGNPLCFVEAGTIYPG